jgi:probable F420-dependent oxidoreductase
VVQVSLFHPPGDFESLSATARQCEELGFDGLFFGEHHGAPQMRFPQVLPLLAGLAARTQRLRLGTSILLSALYDPVHLAESAAVVDQISGGRLTLGLGLGYQPGDFQHFAVPMGERVSRFEEGIDVLRRAWTTERFSFAGKRYQYTDVAVFPKPMQQPHPPLWLAAWSEAGARRAGRLGDAYVTDPIYNLAAIEAFAAVYRAAASDAGRPSDVVLMREFLCAPTRQEALDRYAEGVVGTYRYYLANGAFDTRWDPWVAELSGPADLTFEHVAADRVIVGSADDCVQQLEHWIARTGATHVQLTIPQAADAPPGEPPTEAIRHAAEQVVPRVQGLVASA